MKTKAAFLSLGLVTLVLATAGILRSQNAPDPSADAEKAKHKLAIDVMRAINTAEVVYMQNHGGVYGAKEQLLPSDGFRGKWMARIESLAKAPVSDGPEILPGWSLRLNVTADGLNYDVLLADTTDKSCGYAVVSNETGVIRQSKAIGCTI